MNGNPRLARVVTPLRVHGRRAKVPEPGEFFGFGSKQEVHWQSTSTVISRLLHRGQKKKGVVSRRHDCRFCNFTRARVAARMVRRAPTTR